MIPTDLMRLISSLTVQPLISPKEIDWRTWSRNPSEGILELLYINPEEIHWLMLSKTNDGTMKFLRSVSKTKVTVQRQDNSLVLVV
jgi:hypothetical protein